jgi:hypothetical protein
MHEEHMTWHRGDGSSLARVLRQVTSVYCNTQFLITFDNLTHGYHVMVSSPPGSWYLYLCSGHPIRIMLQFPLSTYWWHIFIWVPHLLSQVAGLSVICHMAFLQTHIVCAFLSMLNLGFTWLPKCWLSVPLQLTNPW